MTKDILQEIVHFFLLFFISLAIVLPIRQFVVQPFLVNGQSMEPSFENFDYLFVERISYYFREPKRGETIVFRPPTNPREYFIKRIIGLPGERVTIENESVIVTKKSGERTVLQEPYLAKERGTQGNVDTYLKDGEYFVLGDNRNASYDSRHWGALNREDIVGRVFVRVWPPSKAQAFLSEEFTPTYQ